MGQNGPPRVPGPRSDVENSVSKRQFLSTVDVFQDLSEDQLREFEQAVRVIAAPEGRLIFEPDQPSETLFLLKSGRVQIYRISSEGKRFVVANIQPGTFFGEMALVGTSMFGAFAQALEDSTVGVLARGEVERLIRQHPDVGVRFMHGLAVRLNAAETQLEDLALKSLASRLATLILRLTEDGTDHITGLTHNDLAERVGTSRETATQALNELKGSGLIVIGRKRIDVVDREGLGRVAETY